MVAIGGGFQKRPAQHFNLRAIMRPDIGVVRPTCFINTRTAVRHEMCDRAVSGNLFDWMNHFALATTNLYGQAIHNSSRKDKISD